MPADRPTWGEGKWHADRAQAQRGQVPLDRRATGFADPSPRARHQPDVEQGGEARVLLGLGIGEARADRPQMGWHGQAGPVTLHRDRREVRLGRWLERPALGSAEQADEGRDERYASAEHPPVEEETVMNVLLKVGKMNRDPLDRQ